MFYADHDVRRGALVATASGADASVSPVLAARASALTPSLLAKMNILRGLDYPMYMGHNFGAALGYYDFDKDRPELKSIEIKDKKELDKDRVLLTVWETKVEKGKETIEEKQPLIGTNRLMMMFGAKDLQLKQWVVTDPQGFDTTIAISNLDSARRPDPSLFKIDYTDYTR